MCNVVRDQWRTGEVGVDGWGGGPLSQGQNAAKLCSSRHDAATRWAVGEYSRVEREGIETAVERECLAVTYLGGRRLSPSRVKKGSTAGVCRSREAEGLRTTSRRAGGLSERWRRRAVVSRRWWCRGEVQQWMDSISGGSCVGVVVDGQACAALLTLALCFLLGSLVFRECWAGLSVLLGKLQGDAM